MSSVIAVQCSVCRKFLDPLTDTWFSFPLGEGLPGISHTYCDVCVVGMRNQMNESLKKENNKCG